MASGETSSIILQSLRMFKLLVYYDSIIEHKQIEKVRKIHQIFFGMKKKNEIY